MGDRGVARHTEREHGQREVALARAVAVGGVAQCQVLNGSPVLERTVHAAAYLGHRCHHQQKALAHLAKRHTARL